MSYLSEILEKPSYGYTGPDGKLYCPKPRELFAEFFSHLNPFGKKSNWLPITGWLATILLAIPLFIFLFHFTWLHFAIGITYSMVFLGSFGTLWFHRYGAHRSFQFRNKLWIFFIRNLTIKIVPEEVYIISHHVHHHLTETPGDPYNVHGGWLYCFLADANHQMISQNLTEQEYKSLTRLISHSLFYTNSYAQYKKWGSLAHPALTIGHYILNWLFWYGCFFLMGGHSLAIAIFGLSCIWAFGIRTFNFEGHGKGVNRHQDGSDFNRADLSVNQLWPGFVAGEWHNNHHLYPQSARAGFLKYQIDFPYYVIRVLHFLGAVTSYKDSRAAFFQEHYNAYAASLKLKLRPSTSASAAPDAQSFVP